MRQSPARTKKILIAIAFLAIIATTANSVEVAQAVDGARQSHSSTSSAPIIFQRSIQPNTLPTEGNPATAVSSLKAPQIRPSPPAAPAESYIFQPQPNGAITALKTSTGKVTYTSSDLSVLLNLMPSNASVTLKSGTYTMRSPYNPKDGQHIIGESRSETKIVGYKTRTDYALIVGSASNLELANFTFNVNNHNPTAKQSPNCGLGILLLGNSNYLHDITLYYAYLQGIVMGLYGSNISNGNLVENCEIYNCGNDGIVLDYCSNSQVRNCYIHDSYGPVAGGVNVAYGSRGCTVRDCRANNTAYGFATDNSMGPPEELITFLHNTANAPYINGFMVDGGKNIAFTDNTASNYLQYGFVSSANPLNSMTPAYVSFNGNTAADARSFNGVGFYISQGSDFIFTNNQALGNLVGFELQIMTGKTQIEDCSFGGNTAHDVMVVNNAAYTGIANCRMVSTAPIWVDPTSAPYTTIRNCVYTPSQPKDAN